MKCGHYTLIIPPDNYPGKRYRGRYAYEHIVEFWKKSGRMPKKGFVVHHRNENKRDNSWGNLAEMERVAHMIRHSSTGKTMAILNCNWCGKEFERQVRQIKKGQERFYCCRSHQVRDQQRRIARYLNLAERRPVKPEVVGSSPTRAAKFRIVIRP